MIISELLIAVFVIRWLQSEFNGEKMVLQKNLEEQFLSAKSRVMDSIIAKNLIAPILNDPKGFKVRTIHEENEIGTDSFKVITYNTNTDTIITDSLRTKLKLKSGDHLPEQERITLRITHDSVDAELYRGVKLFISKATGPEGEADFFERHLQDGDTILLKTYFAENLQKRQLNVMASWTKNAPEKTLPPPSFYFESHFFQQPYGVHIEGYNSFLTVKILPQITFAMLLLIVTSGAFLFSYRSLRNQLRLSAMKDDFISNMSHELKTPLATMKVAIEAMQQMDPAEKKETMKDYLSMTSQELTRLDTLMNKVMNSILPEDGEQAFHFEPVNLKQLIEQALQSLSLNLDQRNATINFTTEQEEVIIHAEAIHVQGIFYNLIDNSLKYGNHAPEISIHLSQTPAEVICTLSDNGPGIPEEYIDKIFEKFFRVPSGNRHNVKGYGLGLNYVSQVMKQHHGAVSVKNLSAKGCQFTLTFPKQP